MMTIKLRQQLEMETIFLISLAALISIFLIVQRNNNQQKFHILSGVPAIEITSAPTVTPTVSPIPKVAITSQVSSDGAKKVIMKVTHNADTTQTYTFSSADGSGNNEQVIFSKTLDSTKSMLIPFNTWSPDNQYFFIQENDKEGNQVFIFKALGTPFADGIAYLDATSLFKLRNTGYNFTEATGWASPTLLILNTTKQDNTKGPSYWFEVPSKAILQLSTEF